VRTKGSKGRLILGPLSRPKGLDELPASRDRPPIDFH
jgi:hypothetical protein